MSDQLRTIPLLGQSIETILAPGKLLRVGIVRLRRGGRRKFYGPPAEALRLTPVAPCGTTAG